MDGLSEKKWFVYRTDHHEGPFSVEEIQGQLGSGQTTSESFVWCDGMADWKPMRDVEAFEALGAKTGSGGPTQTQMVQQVGESSVSVETLTPVETAPATPDAPIIMDTSPSNSGPVIEERTGELNPSELQAAQAIGAGGGADSLGMITTKKARKKVSPGLVRLLLLVALGGGGFAAHQQGYLAPLTSAWSTTVAPAITSTLAPLMQQPALKAALNSASDAVRPALLKALELAPWLSAWISPLPRLDDIAPEDFEALKAATSANLATDGAKVAVAVSKADPLAPFFYVASNLGDGAKFDVYVIGVPDALLMQLAFEVKAEATVLKHLGRTTAVRNPGGKPISRGEYLIFVSPAESQPPELQKAVAAMPPVPGQGLPDTLRSLRVVATKAYFLGGVKDAAYADRLKEFHAQLNEKSKQELSQAKQFVSTLESQLASTSTKFTTLKKGKVTSKQRKAWTDFSTQWVRLQAELDQVASKWTPEILQNDYFYGMIFALVREAGQAVTRVHDAHHSYFTQGAAEAKTFETQAQEATTAAKAAIEKTLSKITQAEALGATPSGMPRREGL